MILLRKAQIFDPRTPHHLKKMDVLIEKGMITKISKGIRPKKKVKIIESKNLSIAPGWLDIGTYNGEPGFEYREDLDSLRAAASNGGYCGLAPFPSGQPTLDSKGQLKYLIAQTRNHVVDIFPIAALTKNRKGAEISELLDLHHAGAYAFSDGNTNNNDDSQLLSSMLYLKSIDGLTIYNASNSFEGHLHEGPISVQMGLEGQAAHIEETSISRIVRHSEYAQSRLLVHNISTVNSLKEIRTSLNKDNLSVSVPFMNLIFEDSDLLEFDLNLKVRPPIRDKKKALSKAVENGQIDIITSNHTPLSMEEKDQPFGLSQPGASTLDVCFSALNTYATGITLERLIYCLSIGPHKALNINCPELKVGNQARITIFDPKQSTSFDKAMIKSKSLNNPFLDKPMTGVVLGLINGDKATFA